MDLELSETDDGTVEPQGHPVDLTLAGTDEASAGDVSSSGTDLASVVEPVRGGDAGVVLGWDGDLPEPSIDGEAATYEDVTPGVDVVVESRLSGFEQHVVINDAAALKTLQENAAAVDPDTAAGGDDAAIEPGGDTDPTAEPSAGDEPDSGAEPSQDGVVFWDLPIATDGLTPRLEDDGSVSLLDAQDRVVSQFATPFAWDAKVDPVSGDPASPSLVDLQVIDGDDGQFVLRVTPDQDWLTDPARSFPIVVDPTYASVSQGSSHDTYVAKASPNTTGWSATELRVGTYNGGAEAARTFINFPIDSMRGKDIVSASLSLYETHSYSCSARSFYVRSVPTGSSGSDTWNNQPGVGGQHGSLSVAKGFSSSCKAGRVSVGITSLVDAWSNFGTDKTRGGLRLHASETDSYGWKKFASRETSNAPSITFTYNRKPNNPSAPLVGAPAESYAPPSGGAAEVYTSDAKPSLSARATDADGSRVKMEIQVHSSTAGDAASLKAYCTTSLVSSGATASCRPPSSLSEAKYYARSKAVDERGLGSGWTGWTAFTVASATPAAPVVSCPAPYGNNTWQDDAPADDVVCTITAAGSGASTAGYVELTVDGVKKPLVKIQPSSSAATAKTTVTFSKSSRGAHSVRAVAVSRAKKSSAAVSYQFGWGPASMSLPAAQTSTTGKVAVAAGGPPRGGASGVTAKVQWRLAGSGDELTGWTDGPELTVESGSATDPVNVSSSWDARTATKEAGSDDPIPSRVPVTLDVQVCFTYAGVATAQCTWSASPTTVTRLPHAFGDGYPVAEAGPGQVALFTGEFNTSATDVTVPGYASDLAVSRSHTAFDGDGTLTGWAQDPVTGVFGPGWTASFEGPEAGAAGYTIVDNTRLDGTIALVDDVGEPLVFQSPTLTRAYSNNAAYVPATIETEDSATRLTITGSGAAMTMKLAEEDGTTTTWKPIAFNTTGRTEWKPVEVSEPGQAGQTTYGHDTNGRVARIVAAVPTGMDGSACPTAGTLAKGCRALDVSYATTTTATADTSGDVSGQVKQISATLWDPATSQMRSVPVATYAYDASKRLVSVTDPRTDLKTRYAWAGQSTHLSATADPGMAPIKIGYDTTDAKAPKVNQISRENPSGAGADVTTSRYVYDVALSGDGLPNLTGDSVASWFQNKAPATGYAVFGQDYTGPVSGGSVDWSYADLSYADELGYTVNAGSYGAGAWRVTATDYDQTGNVVRELDPGAITNIRAAVDPLGPEQVDSMSTQTIYNQPITNNSGATVVEAGTLVTDTIEPSRSAALKDGTVIPVRPHSHTTYDQGAPNQAGGVGINPTSEQPYNLPTTVTDGVIDSGAAVVAGQLEPLEVDSVTTNSYAKLNAGDTGEGDGWQFGTPTKVTAGGIERITRIDTEGRTTDIRQPLSNGNDAGTMRTSYYTAGANSADMACGNRPEWAGLTCRTYPAATPTGGAGGTASMPDTRTTAYGMWLGAGQVVESSAGATRTTSTTFDTAGREVTTATTSTIPGSTARPGTYTSYNADTGLVASVAKLAGTGPGSDRTATGYDGWGRPVSYKNDLGETTTTSYDSAGRVATTSTPVGSTSYAYDGTDAAGRAERRGLVTGQTVTRGSGGDLEFGAAYDADGNMVEQKMPGQINQRTSYDEADQAISMQYWGQVTDVTAIEDPETGDVTYEPGDTSIQPWLAWSYTHDGQGRVRAEATGAAAAFDATVPGETGDDLQRVASIGQAGSYDRIYDYDAAARLTKVTDTSANLAEDADGSSTCTTRAYEFDANSRRTKLTSSGYASGECGQGTADTTAGTRAYDSADRPVTGANGAGQYVYDAFGRQTTLPAADAPNPDAGNITLGYFDDDLPRQITQDGVATTYQLDSAGRRLNALVSGQGSSGSTTTTRHYADGSDNPAWTSYNAAGDTVNTRYETSIGDDLGLTIEQAGDAKLTLSNLHGDIVTTVPLANNSIGDPATSISGWSDYTEYGTPRLPDSTTVVGETIGYGWLGAKQRSTPTEGAGLTLMGVRLYNSTTGLFTSTDPVLGGNHNTYTYPADPINMFDLDGEWGWRKIGRHFKRHWRTYATVASFAVPGLGYAGVAWRTYRVVRAARAYQAGTRSRSSIRSTRFISNRAGKVWQRQSRYHQYRAPAYKNNQRRWSSNFEYRSRGHHQYKNFHVQHRSYRRWK
ncbi:DNRLRE domain-containing protein [Aeromicrobium sp. CF3.5]|uniref:DNRLRE domain-containing protein n=1 Tax=Aeromicrobium sp. CF3.5 TaxID=3373078 RepID=UPI003EE81197